MVWIEEPPRVLIEEDALRFLEGNLVLSLVFTVLFLIPYELYIVHMYNVRIAPDGVKLFHGPNVSILPLDFCNTRKGSF